MRVLLHPKTSVFPCNNGQFCILFRGSQKGSYKGSYNGTGQYIDIFRLFLKRTCNFRNKRYVPPPFYSITKSKNETQKNLPSFKNAPEILFFSPKPVLPIPLEVLRRHLIITGRTGS